MGCGVRIPATTSSPWALTRNSPQRPASAGGRVARERDARARVVADVPEHHLHDVHRRAHVVGDLVRAPVDLGPRRVPRVEDRPHGALELVTRLLRKRVARVLAVDVLEAGHELAEIGGGEVDVLHGVASRLQRLELALEELGVEARDDVTEHLDQAPVGVEREALVAGRPRKAFDRLVVQAQVEDRVHHPGHRDRSARAHGDEQRVGRVPEALPGGLLERADMLLDLLVEPRGRLAAEAHVLAAGLRRHREARRDGQPERGHLGQADALPPEEVAPELGAFREVVDVSPCHCPQSRILPSRPISRHEADRPDPPAGELRSAAIPLMVEVSG